MKTIYISCWVSVAVGGFGDFLQAQLIVPTVSHLHPHLRLPSSFPFSCSRPFLLGHSFLPLSHHCKLPNSSAKLSHFKRASLPTKPVSYLNLFPTFFLTQSLHFNVLFNPSLRFLSPRFTSARFHFCCLQSMNASFWVPFPLSPLRSRSCVHSSCTLGPPLFRCPLPQHGCPLLTAHFHLGTPGSPSIFHWAFLSLVLIF